MQKLSKVGTPTAGGLACSCGSTQFQRKRSKKAKLGGGLIGPKNRLKCLVCKKTYKRG